QDIAGIYNWKINLYERQFPENSFGMPDYNQSIYGVNFTPPGCETISLCFLSNGSMSSHAHLKFYGKTNEQPEKEYLYMLSIKTQFANVETHQFIIQLFRYLNTKYFVNFTLTDDGRYWETNDIDILKTNFKRNSDLISGFSSALECVPIEKGETIENYFKRLLNLIQKRKKQ
ncbi:MAG: hypothetical protein KKG99_13545, partial [Bacteroidetes bacterium]|nr:hypothetical protein [Bacteroidota bacterium]